MEVVNFTHRQLYPGKKSSPLPIGQEIRWAPVSLEAVAKEKNPFTASSRNGTRILQPVPQSLYRLKYLGSQEGIKA